jgi:gluconolactonase
MKKSFVALLTGVAVLFCLSATSSYSAEKEQATVKAATSVLTQPIAGTDGQQRGIASWKPSTRYPDPAIEVLDPSFLKYRIFNASVEMLATGFRWMEGPVWMEKGGYVLVSDIPNNRIIRWDEKTGKVTVYREPSNYANGSTVDLEGRFITCEQSGKGRRITRTERDGKITVLADTFDGKRFNSPNDIVVRVSDGSIWFTDPPFGIGNNYEGRTAKSELPHAVYRIDVKTGKVTQVLNDVAGPNGLMFSQDDKKLYVIASRAEPNRLIWVYDVDENGNLSNKTKFFEALNYGALDGMRLDVDGNIWAGWGSSGALGANPEALDGVIVINPAGKIIGHIHTPERCANVAFGGEMYNRLFMACGHSVYAVYVNTQGAENVEKAKKRGSAAQ